MSAAVIFPASISTATPTIRTIAPGALPRTQSGTNRNILHALFCLFGSAARSNRQSDPQIRRLACLDCAPTKQEAFSTKYRVLGTYRSGNGTVYSVLGALYFTPAPATVRYPG